MQICRSRLRFALEREIEELLGARPESRHSSLCYAQLTPEPRLCNAPLALDRGGREPDDVRGLLDTEPREKPHLDDSCLLWIACRKRVERLVQGDHVGRALDVGQHRLFERNRFDAAATFGSVATATVVDEDAPHDRCDDAEEVVL